MMEYHDTDIRLIGQDNLLSVLVGIKPKPLLFPSVVFLLKYSALLLANNIKKKKRKEQGKKYCAGEWGGRREMCCKFPPFRHLDLLKTIRVHVRKKKD